MSASCCGSLVGSFRRHDTNSDTGPTFGRLIQQRRIYRRPRLVARRTCRFLALCDCKVCESRTTSVSFTCDQTAGDERLLCSAKKGERASANTKHRSMVHRIELPMSGRPNKRQVWQRMTNIIESFCSSSQLISPILRENRHQMLRFKAVTIFFYLAALARKLNYQQRLPKL